MTKADLFDRFTAHGVTATEVAQMSMDDVLMQVIDMRLDEPDDIPLTNNEIAQAIMEYARETRTTGEPEDEHVYEPGDVFQYWAHNRSGEVWAVQIRGEHVIGVCGPLDYTDRPEDMRDFDLVGGELAEDVDKHQDDYRLEEN